MTSPPDDDDNLIEALRRMTPEDRLAALAQLDELRCRLDDDLADRVAGEQRPSGEENR